jgi:hypothetical protein
MKKTLIVGAGMAGLLAASTHFQDSVIIEAQSKDQFNKHEALLRFRSPGVGDAVGIDFKEVMVHKAIYKDGRFHTPNPKICNEYSQKVIGAIQDRSIWNIDTCKRWIAPIDFHEQLIERCSSRIAWKTKFDINDCIVSDSPTISTVPMPVLARMLSITDIPEFASSKVFVKRWKIQDCNVHQTIYFPSELYGLYRASIVGDILTAEYVKFDEDDEDMFDAFDINVTNLTPLGNSELKFGKISPIDDHWRKEFMFKATHEHNVYSLGRFATWRQVLLDDVLKDISIIKKMINSSSYERTMVKNNVK